MTKSHSQPDSRCSRGLLLAWEGLSARYLGCQGNTWVETPVFNQLAAQSSLFEFAFTDGSTASDNLASLCTGRHALQASGDSSPAGDDPSKKTTLQTAGVPCVLLTDDPAQASLGRLFDEVVMLPRPSDTSRSEIENTHLAACFSQVAATLAGLAPPYFCLVHLGSLACTWDAPYAMRARFADPDEPQPPDTATPPAGRADPGEVDPDQVLGWSQAYAAQIELADVCLGALLEELRETGQLEDMLLGLTGLGGYPLGEHGFLGPRERLLHGEATHVPLLLRSPASVDVPCRVQAPVYAASLLPTFCAALCPDHVPGLGPFAALPLEEPWQLAPAQPLVTASRQGDRAVRTAGWLLLDTPPDAGAKQEKRTGSEGPQLYVKPDDRWEVNDVADRCPQIVDELMQVLSEAEQSLAEGRPPEALLGEHLLRYPA